MMENTLCNQIINLANNTPGDNELERQLSKPFSLTRVLLKENPKQTEAQLNAQFVFNTGEEEEHAEACKHFSNI